MTKAEEYANRVKVAVEKAFVTDIETQMLLEGVVKVLGYQDSLLEALTQIVKELKELRSDIPS